MTLRFLRRAATGASLTIGLFCAIPQAISATVTAGFPPGGSALALVLTTVGKSTRQLDVAAYSFTSKPVAEAILAAEQRGVHVRTMVADRDTVETGSFNFTASADSRNAENVVVLQGIPAISSQYEQEFSRLWAESKPLVPGY